MFSYLREQVLCPGPFSDRSAHAFSFGIRFALDRKEALVLGFRGFWEECIYFKGQGKNGIYLRDSGSKHVFREQGA